MKKVILVTFGLLAFSPAVAFAQTESACLTDENGSTVCAVEQKTEALDETPVITANADNNSISFLIDSLAEPYVEESLMVANAFNKSSSCTKTVSKSLLNWKISNIAHKLALRTNFVGSKVKKMPAKSKRVGLTEKYGELLRSKISFQKFSKNLKRSTRLDRCVSYQNLTELDKKIDLFYKATALPLAKKV